MAYDFVLVGRYKGKYRAEIVALLQKVDGQIETTSAAQGSLISASENGKSFTFSQSTSAEQNSLAALLNQRDELWRAYCQVDDDAVTEPDRTVARFC